MGLWASHGCWDGAYGAFQRWRRNLARVAGYKIAEPSAEDRAAGYLGGPYVDIDWDVFEDKNYQGEWDSPPGDDPLLFLIVHSDCDGVIHPAQGIHIARRLEQLFPLLDDMPDVDRDHIQWMQDRTRQFIDGLRSAASAEEDVKFG